MTTIRHIQDHETAIAVADALTRGELVVLPTDTVYGVACSPFRADMIERLYTLKKRPRSKAMQIMLSDIDMAHHVATEIPTVAKRLAEVFWPGALTMTLPKRADLAEVVSPYPTVGVRIPDHERLRALIREVGGYIAITSANLSGEASPVNVQMAFETLGEAVSIYVDGGESPGPMSSTVVETTLSNEVEILRQGPITRAQIDAVLAS